MRHAINCPACGSIAGSNADDCLTCEEFAEWHASPVHDEAPYPETPWGCFAVFIVSLFCVGAAAWKLIEWIAQ